MTTGSNKVLRGVRGVAGVDTALRDSQKQGPCPIHPATYVMYLNQMKSKLGNYSRHSPHSPQKHGSTWAAPARWGTSRTHKTHSHNETRALPHARPRSAPPNLERAPQ